MHYLCVNISSFVLLSAILRILLFFLVSPRWQTDCKSRIA